MTRTRVVARIAAALTCAAAAPLAVIAQSTQPIYLQYDGFVRARDGGYVIAFGYFNMNNVEIPIEPGAANGFTPAPGDRNQPTAFLKGRHRFACVMLVDKSFDGHLQWTLGFAGKTSTTTAKTLDPLYELELNSEKHVLQGLDLAGAPKNVCVNRAPATAVAVSPFEAPTDKDVEMQAKVGQDLAINGHVEDDGLPRGSRVTIAWKKLAGPGDATFTDAAAAATHVRFAAPGTYELDLSATDGERRSAVTVTVRVS
jgi:hypothetical protein